MNIHTLNQLTYAVNPRSRSTLWRGFSLIALACFALSPTARAQSNSSISQLAGKWQASLIWSGSGCGPMSGVVNFNLDSTGTDNAAVLTTHSQGCDPGTSIVTFRIDSLNADGSGTASLTCGANCGWVMTIQVAQSPTRGVKPQLFNMVDIAPENPGNFVEGSAIRQH